MTTTALFDRLSDHLAACSASSEGARALARFAAAGIDLAGADLAGVGDLCSLVRSCQGPDRARRLADLLPVLSVLVPADQAATVTVLMVLRPELTRQARRLTRTGLPPDDAVSVVIEAAIQALAVVEPGTGEEVVRIVLDAVWRRCRTEGRRVQRLALRHLPLEPEAVDRPDDTDEPDVDTPALLRGLRQGAIGPRQARLVYETRGLGRPLVEVAAEWGMDAGALTSTRRRAEHRLRAMIRAEAELHEPASIGSPR